MLGASDSNRWTKQKLCHRPGKARFGNLTCDIQMMKFIGACCFPILLKEELSWSDHLLVLASGLVVFDNQGIFRVARRVIRVY